MPSTRFTKINIDTDVYAMIKLMATAKGVSTTTMLEMMIVQYLSDTKEKD
jgi:hypothetical protein